MMIAPTRTKPPQHRHRGTEVISPRQQWVRHVCQSEPMHMTRFGPCRFQYCTCQSFKYTNDAQFCDNCGHSRSLHQC